MDPTITTTTTTTTMPMSRTKSDGTMLLPGRRVQSMHCDDASSLRSDDPTPSSASTSKHRRRRRRHRPIVAPVDLAIPPRSSSSTPTEETEVELRLPEPVPMPTSTQSACHGSTFIAEKSVFEWTPPASPALSPIATSSRSSFRLSMSLGASPFFKNLPSASADKQQKQEKSKDKDKMRFKLPLPLPLPRPLSFARDRPMSSTNGGNGLGLVLGDEQDDKDSQSSRPSYSPTLRRTTNVPRNSRMDSSMARRGVSLDLSSPRFFSQQQQQQQGGAGSVTQPLRLLRRPETRRADTAPRLGLAQRAGTHHPVSSSDSYNAQHTSAYAELAAFERELLGEMFLASQQQAINNMHPPPAMPLPTPPAVPRRHAARPTSSNGRVTFPCSTTDVPHVTLSGRGRGAWQRPRSASTAAEVDRTQERFIRATTAYVPADRPIVPPRSPLRAKHRELFPESKSIASCLEEMSTRDTTPRQSRPTTPKPLASLTAPSILMSPFAALKIPTFFDASHEYLQDGPYGCVSDAAKDSEQDREQEAEPQEPSLPLPLCQASPSLDSLNSHYSSHTRNSISVEGPRSTTPHVSSPSQSSSSSGNDSLAHDSLLSSPSPSSTSGSCTSTSSAPSSSFSSSASPDSSPRSFKNPRLLVVTTDTWQPPYHMQCRESNACDSPPHNRSRQSSISESMYFTPGASPSILSMELAPESMARRASRRRASFGQGVRCGQVGERPMMLRRTSSSVSVKTQSLILALEAGQEERQSTGAVGANRRMSTTEWRFGGIGTAF